MMDNLGLQQRRLDVAHNGKGTGRGAKWTYWTEIDPAVCRFAVVSWRRDGDVEFAVRRVGGRRCACLA